MNGPGDYYGDDEGEGRGGAQRINRRRFLYTGVTTAAVAAVAGVGGQVLTNKRFNVAASRAAVKLKGKTPINVARVPPGVDLSPRIPGLSAFYTPNATFYRVDTALVVPQVTTQSWSLRIHGMVGKEMTINFSDLLNRPMVERDITLTCVSDNVGGQYISNARWQGVLLGPLPRRRHPDREP